MFGFKHGLATAPFSTTLTTIDGNVRGLRRTRRLINRLGTQHWECTWYQDGSSGSRPIEDGLADLGFMTRMIQPGYKVTVDWDGKVLSIGTTRRARPWMYTMSPAHHA